MAERNTWTGLRRKRREQLMKVKIDARGSGEAAQSNVQDCEGDTELAAHVPSKKMRMNEEPGNVILEAGIEMKQLRENMDDNVSIQITFIRGRREAPQQILQYFKNNLI